MQKHRIYTNIGRDQKVTVELKQDFDILEVLSLKFSQKDIFSSGNCSEYGVVVGRISVNHGLGIPNAKVSIFIPLDDIDENDPVISKLYPYKDVTDKDEQNYRYNLLPRKKQHGGHEPTGTFFDQEDIITREEYLEVFEKYYKYTVKTNNAGDFMIWGVPVGIQTVHIDVDLSDIGCFSFRPNDFIRKGYGVDDFKTVYSFKSSDDLDSLPQIISFNRSIEVYPFWGSDEICEIGITRTDFDLSERGISIEPKAYILGSVYSDQGKSSVNKNCTPRGEMGNKCSLTTGAATIESIRFTPERDISHRPILEEYKINEDVDEDGSFVLPLPMNMDYLYTNEYGENEITNDSNKGVPTSACYRLRIGIKNDQLGRVRSTGYYLLPNIREYTSSDDEVAKSYAWSLDWSDYPREATRQNTNQMDNIIFKVENQAYYPEDYFFRFNYNKAYAVSSFMGSYYSGSLGSRQTFLGIKEIAPNEQDDCENSVVTPPINWAMQNFNFSILLAIMINVFEKIMYKGFVNIIQVIISPFQFLTTLCAPIIDWCPFGFLDKIVEKLQNFGTLHLGIVIYPDCETCDNSDYNEPTNSGLIIGDPSLFYVPYISGTFINSSLVPNDVNPEWSGNNYFFDPLDSVVIGLTTTNSQNKYAIKITSPEYNRPYVTFYPQTTYSESENSFYWSFPDRTEIITSSSPTITYTIYDMGVLLPGVTIEDIPTTKLQSENVPSPCQSYNTLYDNNYILGSYCVTESNIGKMYKDFTYNDITWSPSSNPCTSGNFVVGQVIGKVDGNRCSGVECKTHSGYSEIRYGLFTIVPAANAANWGSNNIAINEYSTRKLVAKLFCEGISNYSFTDNWLSGSLYFFSFKRKIRWDNEETLDLNVRGSNYCENLLYFKVKEIGTDTPIKSFYYRSTPVNSNYSFRDRGSNSTLGHPTTFVDLGPRDEFIKEICIDPSLDPNSSVVRNIGPTSYKNFKDMLGLYINYRLDTLGSRGSYRYFFTNNGYNSKLPNKMDGYVMNGDILQLISMNNEVGIEEFDSQNRNYSVYTPQILDPDIYPILFSGNNENYGPIPINLVLDDAEGLRVRSSLNEPGRLTESSQIVPFYLWDKKGVGFGTGVNQAWDYKNIEFQPLQGMTYGYIIGTTYDPYNYVLFPMTKSYTGCTIDGNTTTTEVITDIESLTDNHTDLLYENQPEGFTYLYITSGTLQDPLLGILYIRTGNINTNRWSSQSWDKNNSTYIIKPTVQNYDGQKQILSTPFLFYFGLRPGKTAVDKFVTLFGHKGAFPTPTD
jgi:hypothetical protein